MHSSKKILKTVLVLVICGILLKGLDTALYPCTFMRNDVHAVVSEQFDDIILGTSPVAFACIGCGSTLLAAEKSLGKRTDYRWTEKNHRR